MNNINIDTESAFIKDLCCVIYGEESGRYRQLAAKICRKHYDKYVAISTAQYREVGRPQFVKMFIRSILGRTSAYQHISTRTHAGIDRSFERGNYRPLRALIDVCIHDIYAVDDASVSAIGKKGGQTCLKK